MVAMLFPSSQNAGHIPWRLGNLQLRLDPPILEAEQPLALQSRRGVCPGRGLHGHNVQPAARRNVRIWRQRESRVRCSSPTRSKSLAHCCRSSQAPRHRSRCSDWVARLCPAFENSSLQATIPLGTFAVIFWLLTLLLVSPNASAIAFTVALDIIRNGA